MKHNILILEDDIALSRGIVLALQNEDFCFFEAASLSSAKAFMKDQSFSLAILDCNLPDGDGLELLTEFKKSSHTAVIMLTAKDLELDIVTGLEMGADDYITKPFSLMVLRARVNAQLRKLTGRQTFQTGEFLFDFEAQRFIKSEQAIELSKTEQKLLRLLIENKGHTVSRDTLVDKIWTDGAEYVDENALSVTIKRLRNKLEDAPSKPKFIKTIYGLGYTWVVT